MFCLTDAVRSAWSHRETMRYYLRTDSVELGPLSQDEIVRFIEEQRIRRADIRTEGGQWEDVRTVRAFREAMPTERPPAPNDARFETVAVARQRAFRLIR